MFYSIYPPSKTSLVGLLMIFTTLFFTQHSHASFAVPLPNFTSSYHVNAFGVDLGKAQQTFSCEQENCTLVSSAKPSGLAALLFSDSSIETIKLKQTEDNLIWLSYHKLGISKKNGKEVQKHTTMVRDEANNQIHFIEKNRTWPIQINTFDIMSISYAIQYFKLNNRPLKDLELHIQDSNFQEPLQFKIIDQPDELNLKFSYTPLKTLKYTFESKQSRIELWLLPNKQYFPAKIRLINKKEDKTITLNLAELPKPL